jgi:L-arabinose isomerase
MNLTVGLLPLYIKLYDDHWPHLQERMQRFYQTIADELANRGMEVLKVPICRVEREFAEAVKTFEAADADAVVTLHLAYSPSLESAKVLADTDLPLIVLDTTPSYEFGPDQVADELLYNHGIHGVQDMCNLLLRNGKPFLIEAGHWQESDVLERISDCVKAAAIAKSLKRARVGRIGGPFLGMGDFAVPSDRLRASIGIETIEFDNRPVQEQLLHLTENQIEEEIKLDEQAFCADGVDAAVHRQSIRAGLTLRKLIADHQLTAFTVNFLDVTRNAAISPMPFLEAGKAMQRGIGYAGEGDVLTAALTGAILSVYKDASFSEMFCPDWKHNRIFLSHMGEFNFRVAAGKPVLKEVDFPFTDAGNPVAACGRFRSGRAVYVCLAPVKDQVYTLIVSPGEMIEPDPDRAVHTVRGWFQPDVPLERFLTDFSRHGGIHHGVLVYGDVAPVMERFGAIMGWTVVSI